MNQSELFDVSRTVPTQCPVPHCGSIRTIGQTGQLLTCVHDLDREQRRRPRGCLNEVDPQHTDIPY